MTKTNFFYVKHLSVYQEKTSGAWFYAFDYQWVTYRSNQGYASQDEAITAMRQHIAETIKD